MTPGPNARQAAFESCSKPRPGASVFTNCDEAAHRKPRRRPAAVARRKSPAALIRERMSPTSIASSNSASASSSTRSSASSAGSISSGTAYVRRRKSCAGTPSAVAAALTFPLTRISSRPAASRSRSAQLSGIVRPLFRQGILRTFHAAPFGDERAPQRLLGPPTPVERAPWPRLDARRVAAEPLSQPLNPLRLVPLLNAIQQAPRGEPGAGAAPAGDPLEQFENSRAPPADRTEKKRPAPAVGKTQMRKPHLALNPRDRDADQGHILRHLAQSAQPCDGNRRAVVLRNAHDQ